MPLASNSVKDKKDFVFFSLTVRIGIEWKHYSLGDREIWKIIPLLCVIPASHCMGYVNFINNLYVVLFAHNQLGTVSSGS